MLVLKFGEVPSWTLTMATLLARMSPLSVFKISRFYLIENGERHQTQTRQLETRRKAVPETKVLISRLALTVQLFGAELVNNASLSQPTTRL